MRFNRWSSATETKWMEAHDETMKVMRIGVSLCQSIFLLAVGREEIGQPRHREDAKAEPADAQHECASEAQKKNKYLVHRMIFAIRMQKYGFLTR